MNKAGWDNTNKRNTNVNNRLGWLDCLMGPLDDHKFIMMKLYTNYEICEVFII